MHIVRYKCEENRKAWPAHKFLMQPIARSINFLSNEWSMNSVLLIFFSNNSTIYLFCIANTLHVDTEHAIYVYPV